MAQTVNCAIAQADFFTWRKLSVIWGGMLAYDLNAGYHTLKIEKRENNAKLDRVAIVKDSAPFNP